MSKIYSLQFIQNLPVSLDVAWDFFSKPSNLKDITPGNIGFNVIGKPYGNAVYPGQVIEYKVRPILGVPLYWMTEITHVQPQQYFVDEQRFGPYRLWHHQHHFRVIEGGVEMTDIVHYKIPYWLIGDMANALFVKRQLLQIFDFRFKAAEEKLGKWG